MAGFHSKWFYIVLFTHNCRLHNFHKFRLMSVLYRWYSYQLFNTNCKHLKSSFRSFFFIFFLFVYRPRFSFWPYNRHRHHHHHHYCECCQCTYIVNFWLIFPENQTTKCFKGIRLDLFRHLSGNSFIRCRWIIVRIYIIAAGIYKYLHKIFDTFENVVGCVPRKI